MKWDADSKLKSKMFAAAAATVLSILIGVSQNVEKFSLGGSRPLFGSAGGAEFGPSKAVQGLPEFITLAKKLKPVVVNISATQMAAKGEQGIRPGQVDPWDELFGMPPPGPRIQQSLGSGFVIDRAGLVLTNNHLVEAAQKIKVKMPDGDERDAKVVGLDPRIDIALIKVEGKESMPTALLGDSDQLEVGEWVMAVGNPFGLDSSVTSGIVSGKGRFIGAGPYDNFIQTDASVNPGNSGGPLVNLRGEVVGITTAIVSQTGASIGIGFAIPINLVKELLPQLQAKGRVTRGWLGVSIQGLTPEVAASLGLKTAQGALVTNLSKNGPADHAGLHAADVITEFDGHPIRNVKDLPLMVARTPVGKTIRLKVLRENREIIFNVPVAELKEPSPSSKNEGLG